MKNKYNQKVMRTKTTLLLFVTVLLFTSYGFAQKTMSNFFRYEGVSGLASLAHPSNTYSSGTYSVEYDYVLVTINYKESFKTRLKIYKSGNVFTSIVVLEDTDWWPPFAAVEFLKDVILEIAREDEDSRKALSDFERSVGKALSNMTGKQLTCIFLTLGWIDYKD